MSFQTKLSEITDILINVPLLQTEGGRRASAIQAGLDNALISHLIFNGATIAVIPIMVETIARYGQLEDKRDALEAFLIFAKENVGLEKKEIIEAFVEHWKTLSDERKYAVGGLEKYLHYIIRAWRNTQSPLLPLDITFSQIAIKLRISNTGSKTGEALKLSLPGYRKGGMKSPYATSFELNELLENLPQHERFLILGDPGTGKTTLLLMEAARLAQKNLDNVKSPIPVFASLASYSAQAEKKFGYSIFDYFDEEGKNFALINLGQTIQNLAAKGKVIFLLDGLDEVHDSIRKSITDRVENVVPSGIGNRIIYTSRKVGFSGPPGFTLLEIAPLNIDEQRRLIRAICGEEKTAILLRNIAGRPDLQDMAAVPMVLIVLALVVRETSVDITEHLYKRIEFLQIAMQILLEGRHKGGGGVIDPEKAEDVLASISLQLHNSLNGRRTDENFPLPVVEKAVESVPSFLLSPWQGARDFIRDVSSHSNIIYSVDTLKRNYRYLHRTFREFFAALELSKLSIVEQKEKIIEFVHEQHWAEVLVLLGGLTKETDDYLFDLLSAQAGLALRTLKEIQNLSPQIAIRILTLESESINERRQIFVELERRSESVAWLLELISIYVDTVKSNIPRVDLYFIQAILQNFDSAEARSIINNAFAYLPPIPQNIIDSVYLGDDVLPYWCEVPSGYFGLGALPSDIDAPDWIPDYTEIYVSSFQIGRVPVTNSLYEIFDPAHREKRDFQDEVLDEELDHHPVIQVSWYEAVVFCQWLEKMYPGVRLPTEAEWEKAASWTSDKQKLKFPWGNDWEPFLLNCWESGPNRTTRVGAYPKGKSPCGALDMAGNVWEWCLDFFEENIEETIRRLQENPRNPYASKPSQRNVDRGGGWYHDVGRPFTYLRAADDPADVFSHCGFRLVRSV